MFQSHLNMLILSLLSSTLFHLFSIYCHLFPSVLASTSTLVVAE
jgi:hypothetical protein